MSLKLDLETNFAECVVDVGKIILGNKQREEMNPRLQEKQNETIQQAICALLNSGGGVVKAEIENEDYNYARHGVGLDLPSIFRGYLDEMQQGNLFLIFVNSWNTEAAGVPFATLCSNLYHRYKIFTDVMEPQEALAFLRRRIQTLMNTNDSNPLGSQEAQIGVKHEPAASAADLFDRAQLQYLEKLNFVETRHVEFKMFSADVSQCVREMLPKCVSALANTEGGYVFFGVHEETCQVIGCEKEKVDLTILRISIDGCIRKLPVHHFCTRRPEIQYTIKFLEVHDKGALYGYVCAVKVEQFCCAVFAKVPNSWHVKDNQVKQMSTKEWATWMIETDPGLKEKEGVICDALLISQNNTLILYTIFSKWDVGCKGYSMIVAHSLKESLVNMGGYTGRLCVTPFLNPDKTANTLYGPDLQIYPESYNFTIQNMEVLLQSLVIVLLGFKSLSDELGSEVLNLLTDKQYELLSRNLHKTRKLFVHGLTGSGKTSLALMIMEKIRNVFHCQSENILYVCENQPLKKFVSKKTTCQAVTRKTFMKYDFENIQHIVIDEAQNLRTEDGDWYGKAKAITERNKDRPGVLWVFLDYFQTNHLSCSGLPPLSAQHPSDTLTTVVRYAHPIADYLQKTLRKVRENPLPNLPPGALLMFQEPRWVQGVPGNVETSHHSDLEEMMIYVAEKCRSLWRNGYSPKDVAVLFSKAQEVEKYKENLLTAMRRRRMSQLDDESDLLVQIKDASDILTNHIVVDSAYRFSGLERNVVFAINPRAVKPVVYENLLLCLASRARKHLYILKLPEQQEDPSEL
ncbi:Schlafen family member 5 [Tupaia chinensis]|uniref:Schlafen family member 5 n=1 Tax=Tupaia chinensis TaxID=246437 RepID=L9KGY0_TUPCH|nr:Schlafen family member 5 [Tupaia chinensis]